MADASLYSFITQPFRFAEASSVDVRNTFQLARTLELQGRFTFLADAQAVANTLLGILNKPRTRFEVPVLGVGVITASSFNGQTPCAVLVSDRFGLSQGRLVLVPDYTIDLNSGQTILRCWG